MTLLKEKSTIEQLNYLREKSKKVIELKKEAQGQERVLNKEIKECFGINPEDQISIIDLVGMVYQIVRNETHKK